MDTLIIGVDPGPTTGIVALLYNDIDARSDPWVLQCNHYSTTFLIGALIEGLVEDPGTHPDDSDVRIAVEAFVLGARSARSGTPKAGHVTRMLIGAIDHQFAAYRQHHRAAATVKPWAHDTRLDAAGLLECTAGMNHARDAARHALYEAVRSGIASDPLSAQAIRAR